MNSSKTILRQLILIYKPAYKMQSFELKARSNMRAWNMSSCAHSCIVQAGQLQVLRLNGSTDTMRLGSPNKLDAEQEKSVVHHQKPLSGTSNNHFWSCRMN